MAVRFLHIVPFSWALCVCLALNVFCVFAQKGDDGQEEDSAKIKETVDFYNYLSEELYGSGSQEALDNALKALELSEKLAYQAGYIKGKFNIGLYYLSTNEIGEGYKYLSEAKLESFESGDSLLILMAHKNIGYFWVLNEEPQRAFRYLMKAKVMSENINNRYERSNILNLIALCNFQMGEFQKAIHWAEEVKKTSLEEGFKRPYALSVYILAKANMALDDYAQAEKGLLEALGIFLSKKDKRQLLEIYNDLGWVYTVLKDRKKAVEYLAEAREIGLELRLFKPLSETFRYLGVHYQSLGMTDSAYYAHKNYAFYSDSASFNENFNDILRMESSILLNARRLSQELHKLKEQNEIKKLEIKKNDLQLKLAIAIAVIFPLLIVALFYRTNFKNRQNRLLLMQNEKVSARRDHRVAIHEELLKTESQLKKVNHTKDTFFAIVTEKLNAPLSGLNVKVEGFVKELPDTPKEDLKQSIESMYGEVSNLSLLLENVLQWSRIQMKRIDFNPEPLDFKAMLEKSIQETVEKHKEKGVACNSFLQIGRGEVKADHKMMRYISDALLDNAFKYSSPGKNINVRLSETDDAFILLEVIDEGVGMNEAEQKQLFQIDANFCRPGTAGEQGTGLSLIICSEFAKMHGYRLAFESERGKGSRFNLYLTPAEGKNKG